jgi:hypothetical protein
MICFTLWLIFDFFHQFWFCDEWGETLYLSQKALLVSLGPRVDLGAELPEQSQGHLVWSKMGF